MSLHLDICILVKAKKQEVVSNAFDAREWKGKTKQLGAVAGVFVEPCVNP